MAVPGVSSTWAGGAAAPGRRRGRRDVQRLGVGGEAAGGAAGERVLPHGQGGQELLGPGPAHGARVGGHDHVRQAEAVERAPVRVPQGGVAAGHALVVDVEAVGVLHRELAGAQQAAAGAGLVPVLGLDLEQEQRQVAVRRAQVPHRQGEQLLVGGRQQVVGARGGPRGGTGCRRSRATGRWPRRAPGAPAPGTTPPGRRRRPSPRGRCARRCGPPSGRAAATRTRPGPPAGRSRPAPAGGGSPPRRRRGRRGASARAAWTCAGSHAANVAARARPPGASSGA